MQAVLGDLKVGHLLEIEFKGLLEMIGLAPIRLAGDRGETPREGVGDADGEGGAHA